MSTENKILVTGATGKIGQHLLKLLDGTGASVTAFVRSPDKVASLGLKTVKAAKGNLDDVKEWTAAVAGHTHLFLLTTDPSSEPGLVRAAISASPSLAHIVKLSCIGADASGAEPGTFMQQHGAAEQEIAQVVKESGKSVVVTHLRPHDFMENIFSQLGTIKSQSTFYGAYSDAAIASISARDIAAVAAAILTSAEKDRAKFANLGFTITGPAALTLPDRCKVISKVIGKEVQYVDVGDAALVKSLEPHVGPRIAYLLNHLTQWYRLHLVNNKWVTGNVEIITGQKPQSWEEFLVENRAAFN
ncbi:NAD(P)-binding protein [Gonapodya prolifera JEL478]|uniref:NAD(P)-binding protein n=1 Tax=Gonapodya prolifera (strain JEL478) TaxID=1344416 RepID=A0A139AD65_GONPJ|nr:NAD(P)-binding protein [Gonapodya prolifera JEL478]|eukprot:KXS14717.1 NAD(P)-binding protein [Gonapodya prolifera JEL478]